MFRINCSDRYAGPATLTQSGSNSDERWDMQLLYARAAAVMNDVLARLGKDDEVDGAHAA